MEPPTFLSSVTVPNPSVIFPTRTIQYLLHITDSNNCRSLKPDTVKLMVGQPIVVRLTQDTIVAEGDQVQLEAFSSATNYLWSPAIGLNNPNIANPIALVLRDITYKVVASTGNNCEGEALINIKVYKNPDLYVPSAFTPNADGKNDRFYGFPVGIKSLKYFRVYNRWGELVFSTDKLFDGWDGSVNGKPQSTAVFVWVAEALDNKGNLISKKGSVTLIR